MTNENNIRAAIDKIMESDDLSIRPIAKEDNGTSDKQVLIRTTEQEREYWKSASTASQTTLSSWIRETLNTAARNILECDHPTNMTRFYPWATICTKCGKRLKG